MQLRALLLSPVLLLACRPAAAPAPAPLSPAALSAANARWPDASAESFENGRQLFLTHCNRCHGYPDVSKVDEDDWPSIVQRMGRKAHLDDAQKELVLRFILAEKAAPTAGGPP